MNKEKNIGQNMFFRYTKLGEPIFIKKDALNDHFIDRSTAISPIDWTPEELRAMANYIEINPNCILFDDGSGGDNIRYIKAKRFAKLKRILNNE